MEWRHVLALQILIVEVQLSVRRAVVAENRVLRESKVRQVPHVRKGVPVN